MPSKGKCWRVGEMGSGLEGIWQEIWQENELTSFDAQKTPLYNVLKFSGFQRSPPWLDFCFLVSIWEINPILIPSFFTLLVPTTHDNSLSKMACGWIDGLCHKENCPSFLLFPPVPNFHPRTRTKMSHHKQKLRNLQQNFVVACAFLEARALLSSFDAWI